MVLPYYILVPRANVIQRFEEESSWQEIVIVEMLQTDAGDELWTVDVDCLDLEFLYCGLLHD